MLMITEPATTFNLTTLDAARSEVAVMGTDNDAYLTSLIEQASDLISSMCNRGFALEGVTETRNLECRERTVLLERRPVVSIDAVRIDGVDVSASGYDLNPAAGILTLRRGLAGCSIIEVDYHAGYKLPAADAPNLPRDIQRAALMLVRRWYFSRGRDPGVRTDEVAGVSTTTFASETIMSSDLEDMLSGYKDVNV